MTPEQQTDELFTATMERVILLNHNNPEAVMAFCAKMTAGCIAAIANRNPAAHNKLRKTIDASVHRRLFNFRDATKS